MERKPGKVVRWLVSTPSSDLNFKINLKESSKEELRQAISIVEENGGKNKTKLTALYRELRRKESHGQCNN